MSKTFEPDLPSTFYRVTSRALIFDGDDSLIIGQDEAGGWQLPGGGMEDGETFEACLNREVREELGVEVSMIGPVAFIYTAPSARGYTILRIAARAEVMSLDVKLTDEFVSYKAVSKLEFLQQEFISAEGNIHDYVDQIWPTLVKS